MAAVVLSGFLAGCEPAGGTVTADGGDVTFTARDGQANVVSMTKSGSDVLITDSADRINAGTGCTQVDAHTARCAVVGLLIMTLSLGDGDDQATNATDDISEIFGGPGDDVLTGGGFRDLLYGDAGADTLNGNPGSDHLGDGASASTTDIVDTDVFIGGGGNDAVSYKEGTAPIVVDLDGVADDGRRREHDNAAADIEMIVGGGGDDRLTGNAADNFINGGPGDDALFGLLGFDSLQGAQGVDSCDVGFGGGEKHPTCES